MLEWFVGLIDLEHAGDKQTVIIVWVLENLSATHAFDYIVLLISIAKECNSFV